MSEMYSNDKDCYLLAQKLKQKLGDKIEFYGSTYINIPSGKYLSQYRRNNGEYMFNGKSLSFYFKFSSNEFLRIGVGSIFSKISLGEKMAALSDFYSILSEEYGEPTVFYTTKDDDEQILSMHWAFVNKEIEIKKFENDTYFDDAKIDKLIVFNKKEKNDKILSDKTREMISKKIGLPFELISLVDEDLENFAKHKNGKEIVIPDLKDNIKITSFEKKLSKKLYLLK